MRGSSAICISPVTASTANHNSITGPNSAPTAAVPRRCITNSASSTTTDSGTTNGLSTGVTVSRPSTAPSTEIAGVITLSP